MIEPVKVAFGEFMAGYYASLVPTTKALHEYVSRGLAKSIAWAPGRMVDSVDEMLSSWQRNDTDSATTRPAKLPVVIVAMAKDYTPTGRDYTRQVADEEMIILPGDPKERVFGLRTVAGDIRAQLAIIASDEPTARSLAAQFPLYIEAAPNRRFGARYTFAGVTSNWPVQIETTEVLASSASLESKNLTCLLIDLPLHATIPLFSAPKDTDPHDGKGTTGSASDPHGYQVVVETFSSYTEARP